MNKKQLQREQTIQIIPWGRNIVALSNRGRICKLMPADNDSHKFKWRLLDPIDYKKLK